MVFLCCFAWPSCFPAAVYVRATPCIKIPPAARAGLASPKLRRPAAPAPPAQLPVMALYPPSVRGSVSEIFADKLMAYLRDNPDGILLSTEGALVPAGEGWKGGHRTEGAKERFLWCRQVRGMGSTEGRRGEASSRGTKQRAPCRRQVKEGGTKRWRWWRLVPADKGGKHLANGRQTAVTVLAGLGRDGEQGPPELCVPLVVATGGGKKTDRV